MHWQATLHVILLLIAAVVSFALALYRWRHSQASGAEPFVVLMVAAGIWSLAYALETSCVGLTAKLFWSKARYLGVVAVPVAWLATALKFSGRGKWPTGRRLWILAIMPLITLALVWTNDFHDLFWRELALDRSGPFPVLSVTRGPWFWVNAVFSYVLVLLGTLLLLQTLLQSSHVYRAQAIVAMLAIMAAWVANALHLARLGPFSTLDLTPFAFVLTGLGVTFGLYRYRMLDIVPIARDGVIEAMSDGAFVLDLQDRIVDINPAAQRIIGCGATAAIGQPAGQLFSGRLDLVETYQDVTEAQTEIALGDGNSRRYYDLRISPLHDRGGSLTGRVVTLRDVTQRKLAELQRDATLEELRKSEARYRSLFDGVPLGLYRTTPAGRILDANLALTEMLGYPDRASLLALNAADLWVNAEDRERWQVLIGREGLVRDFELQLRSHNGKVIWVKDNAQAVRNAEGVVLYYEGSLEDISERVAAKETLSQRNRELALLNQVGQELMATSDVDQIAGLLLREVAETIDAEGASVWLLDDGKGEWLTCCAAYQHDGGNSPVNMRLRLGQGVAGWVAQTGKMITVSHAPRDPRFYPGIDHSTGLQTASLLAVPLLARGRTVGVLEMINKLDGQFERDDATLVEIMAAAMAIAIDNARLVDSLRLYADELETRNAELDAFAHTVAHDLKSPLAKVVGYCEVLEEQHATIPEEELRRYLRTAAQHGRKLSNIVDELLLLAGVRKDEEVEMVPLDMARVVAEAQTRLAYMIQERQVEIVLPDSWPVALGYAPWVEQVWTNYVSNAIKYGGRRPRVELGATAENGGTVRFWVRDNGLGLTPFEQARLFSPFTRLDRVRAEGHGLGLSIVRRIVEKLSGEVGVESKVGYGSVFSFTLRQA